METASQQPSSAKHQVGGTFADAERRLECVTVTVLGHSELQEREHEGKRKNNKAQRQDEKEVSTGHASSLGCTSDV